MLAESSRKRNTAGTYWNNSICVVLGNGEVSKSLKVSAHRFTRSAREKIEKAGGAATVIGA